jgi:pSer/pThr/pTyr-binding forkhead associated (FHA) protein
MDQPPDETIALSSQGPPPLRLVLQPTGAVIEIRRPDVVVGRHSAADVRLSLPDVSRRHCRLFHAEGQWAVVDLDSLNGVWVNQEAVDHAVLHQGDLLRLGGFTFMVDLSQPIAATDGANDGVLRSIFSALPPPDDEQRRLAS